MAKIDLEKLICSLAKRKYFSEEKLQGALKEQDLEYKDGEIVEVQKPLYEVGNIIIYKGYLYSIKEVVKNEERGFHYNLIAVDGGEVISIGSAGEKDIILISNNRFDYEHANIQQKDYAHKEDVKPFDKYKGLTDFERTLADICIGWIGEEPGWEQYIKDNADVLLKIAIEKLNKDFDLVDDKELFFGDFRKTDSEDKGKGSFANRQLYNRAILKILSDYIEKYPDMRFGQMLCNLDVNPHFDEESKEAYWNLCKTINKRK